MKNSIAAGRMLSRNLRIAQHMKHSKPNHKRTLKLLKLAEDLTEKQRKKEKIMCSELLEYLKDIHDYSGFDVETLFQVSSSF